MIGNHLYPFADRILVINNVSDRKEVESVAKRHVEEGTLTRYVVAEDYAEEAFFFFGLKRGDFRSDGTVNADWIYYNALGPLIAIYQLQTDFLLYHTGDVWLETPVQWIDRSIALMKKRDHIQVANLIWNNQIKEVKKESYRKSWNFYYAKDGFSDQQFLVRRDTFRKPIYGEIREDSHHFPRGDVFEKRVFSFLKNQNFERIICRRGSYIHENISC